MATSIFSHLMSLLRKERGWRSHFVIPLFHFWTLHHSSDERVWTNTNSPDFLKMDLKWEENFKECVFHPRPRCFARLLYSCCDFWTLLETQPGHIEVSHTNWPRDCSPNLSTRARWCRSLRQPLESHPRRNYWDAFSVCVKIHFTESQGWGRNCAHAQWVLTKGQTKQTLPTLSSHPRTKRDPHFRDGGSGK